MKTLVLCQILMFFPQEFCHSRKLKSYLVLLNICGLFVVIKAKYRVCNVPFKVDIVSFT